jgi:hypothetical protein
MKESNKQKPFANGFPNMKKVMTTSTTDIDLEETNCIT